MEIKLSIVRIFADVIEFTGGESGTFLQEVIAVMAKTPNNIALIVFLIINAIKIVRWPLKSNLNHKYNLV